jgi:hypothetical protein
MNDNQRFISLQYIKGNNYEEIICFDYENLKKELEFIEKKSENSSNLTIENIEKILDILKISIDDDKCKIGESLLNDLVNYYNFKEIRFLLKKTLLITQKHNENEGYKANNEKKNPNKKLIENIVILKKKIPEIENANIKIKESINPLIDYIKTEHSQVINEIEKPTEENIKELMKNLKSEDTAKIIYFKNLLLLYVYYSLIDIKNDSIEKNQIIKIVKIEEYLSILKNFLEKSDIIDNRKLQKNYENIENIIKLFKYYIRLCNTNIGKYEKIFKKNEISNIDDAFMIESYSKFLKKLKILKENLESEDEDKLKRLLVNSLNKLFNLYGIDLNKTFGQNDIDYMKNYILYY